MTSRANKKRQRRLEQAAGPEFHRHPLCGIPKDALATALSELGKSEAERFPDLLMEIQELLLAANPLGLLAVVVYYGVMGTVSAKGEVHSLLGTTGFSQPHVELLQALMLRAPLSSFSDRPVTPVMVEKVIERLPELARAFAMRRFMQAGVDRSVTEGAEVLIQEGLRGHTQTVRNWGFYHTVLDTCRTLIGPIDHLFQNALGLSGTALIRLFEYLMSRQERLATEHMNKLAVVVPKKSVSAMVQAYYSEFPGLKDSPEELIQYYEAERATLEQVKCNIMAHSDLALYRHTEINVAAISHELGFDPAAVQNALTRLSLGFGDLEEEDPEHFFLRNPVWTKPVIRLTDDDFFCPLPATFFSFVLPSMSGLLENDKAALAEYFDRRSAYLEDRSEALFRSAFSDCECVRNYRWRGDGAEYETDLVVRVDSHLFIVEAKAGVVSWPALRGGTERAKTHARELLFEPSVQSLRFQRKLEEVQRNPELQEQLLPRFGIDLAKVRTILRVSVTLDDFAVLQSNLRLLKDAGWIPPEHPLPVAMSVADLELVFDVLEATALKLHYIRRRTEIQNRMRYVGDEVDMLGFYLETGFNIGTAEIDGPGLILTGMSEPIDQFYVTGQTLEKPKPKLTRWWSELIVGLEQRGFAEWSEIATIVLNFSHEEQVRVEQMFSQLCKEVRKNERRGEQSKFLVVIPAAHRSDAIAIVAFGDAAEAKRALLMQNAATGAFNDHPHVKRCVVIGRHIDHLTLPYTSLAAFHAP